jgi:hypothetical protein
MRFNEDRFSIPENVKNILLFIGCLVLLGFIVEMLSFSRTVSSDDIPFNQNFKVYAVPLPDTMSFCGEKVPMNHLGVREGLEQELLVNTYFQSQSILMLKRAHRYFPIIEDVLRKNSIPDDFKYLALAESAFSYKVSPAGAVGFWQLMRATADDYGLEIDKEVDERYNLERSTEVACKYFKDSYAQFHNWTLAAASYNMGMAGLGKEMEKEKEGDYYDLSLNLETSRYVYRILALKAFLQHPETYGYFLKRNDLYEPIPTYTITIDTPINSLAEFAAQKGISFHTLKFLNPWLMNDKLPNPDHRTYTITLPRKETAFAELGENITYSDSMPVSATTAIGKADTNHPKIVVHIVTEGENIESIAHQYNVSVEQLRIWNSISDTVRLKLKDELMIFLGQK